MRTLVPVGPPTELVRLTGPRMAEVIDGYVNSSLDSPHSRRQYRRHLRDAIHWLRVEDLHELDGATLAAYRAHVMAKPLAPASQALALGSLRSFLRWSRVMGGHSLPPEVIDVALRLPQSTVVTPFTVLSEPEITALFTAAATVRDRAVIGVMLGGGLRVAEVVALDVGDVHEDQDGETTLHVRQGKGRKDRMVPVQQEVSSLLRAYLAATKRHIGGSGPLFLSEDNWLPKRGGSGRVGPFALWHMIRVTAKRAEIVGKRVSPHALRHTFAVRALRSGNNVVAVSKLLGHASISTTQRYIDHLELGELRAAVPPLPLTLDGRITGQEDSA